MEHNILDEDEESLSYEVLEKGDNHAVAEVNGEKYLIEKAGFDEEAQRYLFDIIDNETVCVDGDHSYKGPNRVSLSASEVESSEYDQVIDSVLEKGGTLRQDSEGFEELSDFY